MKLIYSLRFRLSALFFLTISIPTVILMYVAPAYYQGVISKETTTLTEATLAALTHNIETYLDDLERLTTSIPNIDQRFLDALNLRNNIQYHQFNDYTKLKIDNDINYTLRYNLQNTREDISEAILVTNDGTPYVISKRNNQANITSGYIFTEQDWYKKASEANGSVVFIGTHLQSYLQSPKPSQVFSVARLIKDPDSQKSLGVIMADADTILLEKIFSGVNFNVTSVVSIFDNNSIIYSNKSISPDMKNQILNQSKLVKGTNDSYVIVTKSIERTGWKMVILLSHSELDLKLRLVYVIGIFFAIGEFILAFSLFLFFSRIFTNPFKKMITVMREVEKGNLQTHFEVKSKDEISQLGNALNRMILRLNDLIDREYRAVLSRRNAEYNALQSQIQPHFLYNTLNGFIGLNRLGERDILEKAIFALTGMFRYTLEHGDWTTIAEECLLLQRYSDIQKLRFQDRLEVNIHFDDSTANYKIPKLLLQPLVENSIIHGIEPLDRPGQVTVSIKKIQTEHQDDIQISIEDNGMGFNMDEVNEESKVGLSNVRERLTMAYPRAKIFIKSQLETGTLIIITIPEKDVKV